MSKHRHRPPANHQGTAPPSPRRKHLVPVAAIVALAAALVVYAVASERGGGTTTLAPVASAPTANVTTASAPSGFQRLKGRWLRPDGGYIMEIRDVAESGAMEAAYFNPRSIHVARAEAAKEGDTTKVVVELRDRLYPGSTYTLNYDPQGDQLKGNYYHAGLQQNFDVVFVRTQ